MKALCLYCRQITVLGDAEVCPDACPKCGDLGVPADADHVVHLTLTYHELRVLVMWAEKYAASISNEKEFPIGQKIIYGIVDAIAKKLVETGQYTGPLTFAGELSALRERYPGLETNFPELPL